MATQNRTWDDSWGSIFTEHNASLFDKLSTTQWNQLGTALKTHYPDQAQELTTIASEFQSLFPNHYVSYEYLTGWVYFHSLAHTDLYTNTFPRECTGLLTRSTTGEINHVANMDQSPATVRNVTLQVQFVNGSEVVLFSGVDWYWFTTGTSRMVLPNVVSVQENWRTSVIKHQRVFEDIYAGVIPQIFVFRRSFERIVRSRVATTFENLVTEWSNVRLAAPFYIVMAGAKINEGAVIARNETGIAAPNGVLRMLNHEWYLVQTNYDHWVIDNAADPRRTVAETLLNEMDPNNGASSLSLFAVASSYPIHNPHTAYTAVMNAKKGTLFAFVRTAMCPQNPENTFQDSRYCSAIK